MLQRPCVIKIICFHHILHRCSHPRCSMYQLASSSDKVTKRRWSLKQAIMSQPEWKITMSWLPWLMVFVASKWIWFLGQTKIDQKLFYIHRPPAYTWNAEVCKWLAWVLKQSFFIFFPCSSHSLLEKIATKGTGAIADSASVPEYLEATNMTSAMPNSPWESREMQDSPKMLQNHTSNTFESFNPYYSDIFWFLNVCPEEQCI